MSTPFFGRRESGHTRGCVHGKEGRRGKGKVVNTGLEPVWTTIAKRRIERHATSKLVPPTNWSNSPKRVGKDSNLHTTA